MDTLLGALMDAGYDTETAHHAWHVVASHVLGYAFQETNSLWAQADHDHSRAEAMISELRDRFPNVARLAPYIIDCAIDDEFQFGLDIILDGVEARRPS